MSLELATNVQYIKGVGPKLGILLGKRDISTVSDLLNYFPRAYEDRRAARNIASLKALEVVSLKAHILKISSIPMGRSQRRMYDIALKDSSGTIHCKFFRVPYKGYFERFPEGSLVRVSGKVIVYRGRLEFHHPDLREYEDEEISDIVTPIYAEIENLSSAKIHRFIKTVFENLSVVAKGHEKFPAWMLEKYQLISRDEALKKLHFPEPDESSQLADFKSPGHRRIIFEDFFWLELYLAAKKAGLEKEQGIAMGPAGDMTKKLLASLPFQLTGAQKKACREVHENMRRPTPMNRLVQGDVGSGKTLVAFLAALQVMESGYQCCMMAPTEILAEQHFKQAQKLLEPLGLRVGLLTGKTKAAERNQIFQDLQEGQIHFLLGTHAVIEDRVEFVKLGLVIIDEQHRFGVEQRGRLKNKGESPHFLVMTATPIPRTLAMTVYGDLEVSVIDEMPPGRTPIQTRVVSETKRPQAMLFMEDQIKKGHQAYIVYPLVEESEKMDLKNAVDEYEKLKLASPHLRIGLLHGRMKAAEKEEIMEEFRAHRLDVLMSTTVIEVGVDVPNANIMIIEHAERFGLSQLHQLRGRVGRGVAKSYCILIHSHALSEEGRLRTQMMEQTTDGFKIAEFDLEMRGPGEFMGTRQSGLAGFHMANLVRDAKILEEARSAAFEVIHRDPSLKDPENLALRNELLRAHGPAELASIA